MLSLPLAWRLCSYWKVWSTNDVETESGGEADRNRSMLQKVCVVWVMRQLSIFLTAIACRLFFYRTDLVTPTDDKSANEQENPRERKTERTVSVENAWNHWIRDPFRTSRATEREHNRDSKFRDLRELLEWYTGTVLQVCLSIHGTI
jgi:hypothetical protein